MRIMQRLFLMVFLLIFADMTSADENFGSRVAAGSEHDYPSFPLEHTNLIAGSISVELLKAVAHDAILISMPIGMLTLRTINPANEHPLANNAGFFQKISFAVHKSQSVVLAGLNEGSALTRSSGIDDALHEKWSGVFEKRPFLKDTFKYLIPMVCFTLLLAVFFLYKHRQARKQADNLLRASENRLRTLFETSAECIKLIKIDGTLLAINTAGLKMLEADDEKAVVGHFVYDFVATEYREAFRQLTERVCHGQNGSLEFEIIGLQGTRLWVETRAVPFSNLSNGELVQLAISRDITEYKQIELREQCYTQVLELLNIDSPLPEILDTIARSVELENPAMHCSIVMVDQNVKFLSIAAAPSLPDFNFSATDSMRLCSLLCFRDAGNAQQHTFCQLYRKLAVKTGFGACWSEAILDKSGKALGAIALHHHKDIALTAADLKLIKHAVHLAALAIEKNKDKETLQLASLFYDNSSEAIMITDADSTIVAHNAAFTELTDYPSNEVIGNKSSMLKSGRHDKEFYQAMWSGINTTGHWQGNIWNKRKNGEIYLERLTINTIYNPDGTVHRYVAMFSDITQKKQAEQLIWQQANFDPLTGLPNRRMFHDRLVQEIKKTHRAGLSLALMFLDLDHFKEINDTLGHNTGDLLLIETARRIADCVRESDTVARLGGDEFTIILSEIDDPTCVERIARNIVHKISEPFRLRDEVAYVSISIGITQYPGDTVIIEDLLKYADQAMYESKNQGRNCYHYYTPAMQAAALNRMKQTDDLRSALADHQFRLVYQPIIELATGAIDKAEALIRWQHPMHGLIGPAEFIQIAEKNNIIVDIGNWVFRQAARQNAQWRESHHKQFQISVNQSLIQFHPGNSHAQWFAYLQALGLPGLSMVLEITEALLLDASSAITEQLLEFSDAGIQVSLDDFGTGYSSLTTLKKFNISYLKIDRSLVRKLALNFNDMALCEGIILMAHKLGIKVIAEGIETAKQHELLVAAGCDYGQGYLFSRPVPADEFEALLCPAKN